MKRKHEMVYVNSKKCLKGRLKVVIAVNVMAGASAAILTMLRKQYFEDVSEREEEREREPNGI